MATNNTRSEFSGICPPMLRRQTADETAVAFIEEKQHHRNHRVFRPTLYRSLPRSVAFVSSSENVHGEQKT
jgi:hypothetical protein